jgi:hypothetical protein
MYTKTDTKAVQKKRKYETSETHLCCTARQAPMLYKRKRFVHLRPCFTVQKDRHPCSTEEERVVHLRPCFTVLYRRTDNRAVQKKKNKTSCTPMLYKRKRVVHLRHCFTVQKDRHPCCTEEERVVHLRPCFCCTESQKTKPY